MTDNTSSHRRRLRPSRGGDRPRGFGIFLRDILVIFVVALLISFLVKTYLIRSFYIPSGSMENTLQIDDRIIVNELVPDLIDVKRGDVIVFTDPGGWLDGTTPVTTASGNPLADGAAWFLTQIGLGTRDSNDHLIKRVIGLPGDTVSCCNDFGQMSVNGVPLTEPYVLKPEGESRVSGDDFSVTVPADSLWVMGDNRYNSKDSRYNGSTPSRGFVPLSDVVGRAFVVSWPSARWQWLDDHPEVFRGTEREGE
jgi:signal peptidase I